MNSWEIRSKFLKFFEKRGHVVIQSASLVTSDKKGVTDQTLFNTAGMQPLVPYLLGREHPMGKRLVDVQKCLRTVDIDGIGDKTHATFFEMLGNWSLGDYFKKEAIAWSYEFLTSKEEGLGLDPNRLYVSVFEGDADAPRDDEAASVWREIFSLNDVHDFSGETEKGAPGKIFYLPKAQNWWEAGDNGPCGPDTEMYYDISGKFAGKGLTKEQFISADEARDVVEVWNNVFMQYEKRDGKIVGKLPKPSVDTGAGLERLAMTLRGVDNIYETDLLSDAMTFIRERSHSFELRSGRIVADHIRASVFLIADGVEPSNTGRGYILRRLIRRAVRYADKIGMKEEEITKVAQSFVETYKEIYPELEKEHERIKKELSGEEKKFRLTLSKGLKELEKIISLNNKVGGGEAFDLYQTYGFPIELLSEIAKEKNVTIDIGEFESNMKAHQALSRAGAEKKFKGGLSDHSDPSIVRYHTATHLLHQALGCVLGTSVMQKGSNITPERLRFDFTHSSKMTEEEKLKVEEIVNAKIEAALPVNWVTMSKEEAEKTGARHLFGEKYGDSVSIYFIGNDLESAYSKEFCGGPHVTNTRELAGPEGRWRFKIMKEEAVSQGVRRIKAVIQ